MINYEELKQVNAPFIDQLRASFDEVLNSGWYILGQQVKKFEDEFAKYLGADHCAGLASGLDALLLALKAFEFPEGSEVIVPSNTYIATIIAIANAGCKPVLVEPDINTYNIDPSKIEEKITSRTKAIMIVHLYGKTCQMDKIMALCTKHNLKLVEDCAQSHGSKFKGKMSGTFGDFGAFSFYPTKNLGALGDGGALVSKTPQHNEVIRKLRNYGSGVKYYNELIGYNSRLDEVQAGFLSVKLKKLDDINKHKQRLASLYLANLKQDFIKPVVHPDFEDVYHIFNVRHPKRDQLKKYMEENGVKTEIHYPVAPHRQAAFKDMLPGSFPISEEIHATTLSLPISYGHTEDEVLKVIEVMNCF